jgi:hypothetical protein
MGRPVGLLDDRMDSDAVAAPMSEIQVEIVSSAEMILKRERPLCFCGSMDS